MACNDPAFFFFEKITAPASYTRTLTGPAGQFTADSRFRNAKTGISATLKDPQPLADATGKNHVVNIILFFAADSDVTVEAECAGQKYCRKISGKANTQEQVTHILPMA